MTELVKCSGCKCLKLPQYFAVKESTGKMYKTCIPCRDKIQCTLCPLKFRCNPHLERHIKAVHNKIKDQKCPQCDYTCSVDSALADHVNVSKTCCARIATTSALYNQH